MKTTLKNISSSLLIICMCLHIQTLNVSADGISIVSVKIQGSNVIVEGMILTDQLENIMFFLYKKDEEPGIDNIILADSVMPNEGGLFSFSFNMPSGSETGEYMVLLQSRQNIYSVNFKFFTPEDILELLYRINYCSNAGEVCQIFSEYSDLFYQWDIMYENYLELPSKEYVGNYVLSNKTYANIEELRNRFREGVLLALINTTNLGNINSYILFEQFLYQNSLYLNIGFSTYETLSVTARIEVLGMIRGKEYLNILEFRRNFEESIILALVNNHINSSEQLEQLICEYNEYIGINVSKYNSFNEDDKSEVFNLIRERKYSHIYDFIVSFDNVVAKIYNNNCSMPIPLNINNAIISKTSELRYIVSFSVASNIKDETNAILYICFYDANDVLLELKRIPQSFAYEDVFNFYLDFYLKRDVDNTDKIKIFAWDNSLSPLSIVIEALIE